MTDDAKDAKIVQVTLDGMWEMQVGHPNVGDLKVGDVRRIHPVAGNPYSEVGGWAFVYRIVPERYEPMKGGVIPAMAVMYGAVVADTPERTAKDFDGEPIVIQHYNYGIDEKLIEGAVRHAAERHVKRGGQDPPVNIPMGGR